MFGLFKKWDKRISNKDELISTLTRIVEILRDSAYTAQADAVRKPLQYLMTDDLDKFYDNLLTVDIWGGSGAAWEVGLFPNRALEIEFEKCFIKLVDIMEESGIRNGKARSVRDFFKKDIKR